MPTAPGEAGASATPAQPAPMMRQGSQSSYTSARPGMVSPGSGGDDRPAQQRPHVKPGRHTKIVLPRNLSSARNLAKLNRPSANVAPAAADDLRKHARQRSHEGDTEIRLPGSLDEREVVKPPMRRNMTAYQLSGIASNAKMKKNLSHGQLSRLASGKNLVGLFPTTQRAPTSPRLKGKSKRPKSAEIAGVERETLERAAGLDRHELERKRLAKKVGFAVGSAGDDGGDEADDPQMEGSGLQEDEWTEESASASPYSTRQNTANNSRRASVIGERPSDKSVAHSQVESTRFGLKIDPHEAAEDSASSSEAPSPLVMEERRSTVSEASSEAARLGQDRKTQAPTTERSQETEEAPREHQIPARAPMRSPLHQAKEHPNPTTRRLLNKSQQLPAPALLSNVSAMDDTHSDQASPAPSLRSSRSNLREGVDGQQEDELISRFVPSASHPSAGSGPTTAANTPKESGMQTPEEEEDALATQASEKNYSSGFQIGPTSPGSTISPTSSGAVTPALGIGRSRTELRMMQEKALAELESSADQRPYLPAHVFDRRNESLKSYLSLSMASDGRPGGSGMPIASGPDVFQGRFRALNTELRVVQKFRDPIGEAVARLRACPGSRLHQRTQQQTAAAAAQLPSSKSAASLPSLQRAQKTSEGSKFASSPSAAELKISQSSMQVSRAQQQQQQQQQQHRREVSFARIPQQQTGQNEMSLDAIARKLWESV